jgi:hypothetical protein
MTDRVRTLTVVLDREYRDDDVQVIVSAIGMLRGVQGVQLGPIENGTTGMAIELAKSELRLKVMDLLEPEWSRKARERRGT